jgi:DNA polymerase-3 subunit alpha
MGTEILVESGLDSAISHKLILLAKNLDGYKNIIALTTKAGLESETRVAQVTIDMLREHAENLVCLSGPIN